ncbi:protein of unknown function (plasmid) [Cupriavidus taiwanensis]|uniref:Uncharacterized protein n=1 Tax=Cupriavidus taiwanensis TaxID=164546 RepID=A0A9Q7V268_9BURK|nr:protein of unknown function [Cupriavidus taiwanensis]
MVQRDHAARGRLYVLSIEQRAFVRRSLSATPPEGAWHCRSENQSSLTGANRGGLFLGSSQKTVARKSTFCMLMSVSSGIRGMCAGSQDAASTGLLEGLPAGARGMAGGREPYAVVVLEAGQQGHALRGVWRALPSGA